MIDLEALGPRDRENLVMELLAAMGFRKITWEEYFPGIDLIAELPKKDPDGFEYHELWIICFIQFFHPIIHLDHINRFINNDTIEADKYQTVSVLHISTRDKPELSEQWMANFRSVIGNYPKHIDSKNQVRFRYWDRMYLLSLIDQYPMIRSKYFLETGRQESRIRKTYEELYNENIQLLNRLTLLTRDREAKENLRTQAERDSVWQELGATTAHRIGNPLFFIDTSLELLQEYINQENATEALKVVDRIRTSVERIKILLKQFKSLAIATEIHPEPLPLLPLLRQVVNIFPGIPLPIVCPENLTVYADPEKLAECLDELLVNASYWLDKEEKHLTIEVCPAKEIPDSLDGSKGYILITIQDNGPGVPHELKERIFDSGFSRNPHGSGLGLALVRRILEAHAGHIRETGIPGEGARFELFLPMATRTAKEV
ncbi:MAG: HAMP domain-containing histidine kinase [Magnetococcales bacterium]|nr:HAMP domain-containing histidine kinase [Magnetococcales bacterium]